MVLPSLGPLSAMKALTNRSMQKPCYSRPPCGQARLLHIAGAPLAKASMNRSIKALRNVQIKFWLTVTNAPENFARIGAKNAKTIPFPLKNCPSSFAINHQKTRFTHQSASTHKNSQNSRKKFFTCKTKECSHTR